METPGDREERGRRDALVEPLFGGLDAAQGAERASEARKRVRLGSRGVLLALALAALSFWLLS